MANQYFPLLPKLKDDSAITPSQSSIWEEKSADFLDSLIKSLAVPDDASKLGEIDSIPDVWARPLLFEMALFDKQGANDKSEQQFQSGLFQRVQGEWRCLLAMLALNEIKHLNLRAEQVSLDPEGGVIEKILSRLAPAAKGCISEDTDWSKLYIIFYKDVPIGMTSPTTLVAAAADYMASFYKMLPQPWSQDGIFLSDPVPYLAQEELASLYGWLKNLEESLRQHVAKKDDNNAYLMTSQRLEEYCRDIENALSKRNSDIIGAEIVDGRLKISFGIFKYLDRVIKAKKATAQDSQVKIEPSKTLRPNKNLLLVSPLALQEIADSWGIDKTQLVVWQGLTANDINESMLTKNRSKIGNILLDNTEYRRPEEFFTDHIAVIEPKNAFVGSRKIKGMEIITDRGESLILPLKKEILDYFTPDEIAERFSIQEVKTGLCVSFNFPLSGKEGARSHDYTVYKMYAEEDMVYFLNGLPNIEIWPDFCRDGWNKYYYHYANENREVAELCREIFYAEPWNYGKEKNDSMPDRGIKNRYTAQLDDFPDALLCTANRGTQNGSPLLFECGIILLKRPPKVEINEINQWDISIDFGTSSTMLYYRENESAPQPLVFNPHIFQVIETKEFRNNLFFDFMPSMTMNKDGSFQSIYHLLNTKDEDLQALQDGNIFALDISRAERFIAEGPRMETNLKWQSGSQGTDRSRRKAKAYLEQICLQSAAEAAACGTGKLKWHFSYPSAFSAEEKDSFKTTCKMACDSACANTVLKEGASVPIDTKLESVAIALYFNKLNNSDTNFGDGALCIDIGAGTTDISVISGRPGSIVYNTSVRFAGRRLFAPLYKNYKLFGSDKIKLDGASEAHRTAIIDSDMRERSEKYLKNLTSITGKDEIKKVLQKIQFGMAGLFYYLGKILAKLHADGIYAENHVPDIYIGGNGARAFSWLIGGGDFANDSIRLVVLKKAIEAAAGMSGYDFNIYLSERPKIEVASGMIAEEMRHEFFNAEKMYKRLFGDTEDDFILNSVIAGEPFRAGGKTKDKSAFLSAHDMADGIAVDSLPEFGKFVAMFNESKRSLWLNGITYDDKEQSELLKRVSNYYVSEQGKKLKEVYPEPVYIAALTKMMELVER